MSLAKVRKKIDGLLADFKAIRRQCKAEQQALREAEDHSSYMQEAQEIAQQVAQTVQQQAHRKIAGVVSRCLQTVFTGDDVYGFKIDFVRKRGRTEARLILLKNGHEIEDPMNEDSGGVVDVAALALRLACLVLAKPRLRRLLVLDEPFKFVDKENLVNVRKLLEGLAKDFGVQFIMVTHIRELQTGKVIEL